MSDFGAEKTFWVNTHLGELITYNDCVLGYDLEQINNETLDKVKKMHSILPDVILIRKYFPKYRKNLSKQSRNWKLKHLTKEEQEEPQPETTKQKKSKSKPVDKATLDKERDYEMFLQELEDDRELRQHVNIYQVEPSSITKPEETKALDDDEDELDLEIE